MCLSILNDYEVAGWEGKMASRFVCLQQDKHHHSLQLLQEMNNGY